MMIHDGDDEHDATIVKRQEWKKAERQPEPQGEATGVKTQAEVVLKDLHSRLQAGAQAFIQNPDEEYNDYVESWDFEHPETRGSKQQPAEWMMTRIATHVGDIIAETQRPQKNNRADV